jgi:D-alanyl-D-alanine carboxypeptidase
MKQLASRHDGSRWKPWWTLVLLVLAACSARMGDRRSTPPTGSVGLRADALLRAHSFHGVVLLGEGSTVVHAQGHGMANFEDGVASSVDTKYQTGSFSKWVASVVVLQLVDAGTLSLTTHIGDYLPQYRRDTGAKLTLHHLLSHTSGVPNHLIAALREKQDLAAFAALGTDEAVALYASGELLFEPGARFDYSHSNWLLVKAIIEHATHKPYRQVIRELLLAPLQLEGSGILEGDFLATRHAAQGYATLEPTPRTLPRGRVAPIPDIIACMGGFYATAPDVHRLLEAVYAGNVLTRASRERLTTVVVADENYAYGGRVRPLMLGGVERRVSWNNNSNGAYKSLMLHSDDGKTVVLLNNTSTDQEQLGQWGEELLRMLYDGK